MMYKISILGTDYIIMQDANTTQELITRGSDGETNLYSKIIYIRDVSNMLDKDSPVYEQEARYKEVMRHEIIHAFLFEAGLSDYCMDEVLVDWIAKQWNKINKTFKEVLELK